MWWVALIVGIPTFPLYSERQFYDDLIPCLGLDDNCGETPGLIKDDEIHPPYEGDYCPIREWKDDTVPESMGEDNDVV